MAHSFAAVNLGTCLCQQADFSSSWYRYWVDLIAEAAEPDDPIKEMILDKSVLHRKFWEWSAIAQALHERGMLTSGNTGIGFAVGREPLSSLFASLGVKLLVSDYIDSTGSELWSSTGQLGDSLEKVHWPGFLPFDTFLQCARFQCIDMRDLSSLPKSSFDFSWSSCSFEHLGSLTAGIDFLMASMDLIKKGGVGIHTTEYNLSSNEATIEFGDSVIYRRQDIERLDQKLRRHGCALERVSFEPGFLEHDVAFDYPPYFKHGRQHVKLLLGEYVSTSILLIIKRWT